MKQAEQKRVGIWSQYYPLAERAKQLDDEIPHAQAELDAKRIALLSHAEIISGARDLYARWPELPFAEKRSIVEAITDRIVINAGEVEINLFYAPSAPTGGEPDEGEGSDDTGGSTPPPTSQNGSKLATQSHRFIDATTWKPAGIFACRAAQPRLYRLPGSGASRGVTHRGPAGTAAPYLERVGG